MTYRVRNIALAIGLALVAMLLTIFYVTNYKRSVESSVSTVKVYVASEDLPAGTAGADLVAQHDLKLAEVPKRSVVPGAITKPDEVRNLVLATPLYAGEQVTIRRFTDVTADGIRAELKGTMRAVQVAGDQNQVLSGTLQIGDRVDVVGNIKLANDSSERVTRIVLRDLEVLGIPSESVTADVANDEKSVILAVTDVQVQRLFFVLKNAEWTLQLRPVLDPADSAERLETTTSVLQRGTKQ
jgi:Flp pilus assembly protein CpaB